MIPGFCAIPQVKASVPYTPGSAVSVYNRDYNSLFRLHGYAGYSIRQPVPISASGRQFRFYYKNTVRVDNISAEGFTSGYNAIRSPREFTFGGVRGITGAHPSAGLAIEDISFAVSDWLEFPYVINDSLLFVFDVSSSQSGGYEVLESINNDNLIGSYKAATDSYDQATPAGIWQRMPDGGSGNNGAVVFVAAIEAR